MQTTAVRELEKRLIQSSSAHERLGTLLELAGHQAAAFHNREGLRTALEALRIARGRGDAGGAARALAVATLCHTQRGDHVAAVASGLDALEAHGDDRAGRSCALQGIALALFALEAFEASEAAAAEAVGDAVAAGDVAHEAASRAVLGEILCGRGRFRAARRELRIAAAIQRGRRDPVMLKKALAGVGHTHRAQAAAAVRTGRAEHALISGELALRAYRAALASGTSDGDDALAHAAISDCHARLGRPSEALLAAEAALERALPVGSAAIVAECALRKVHALRALGRLDEARHPCALAREAAEHLELGALLCESLLAESCLAALQGRFESAGDLEARARDAADDRRKALERLRGELTPLWDREAARRLAGSRRAA